MRKTWMTMAAVFVALAGVITVSGCGSSGGSSSDDPATATPSAYTGETLSAVVDAASAEELALAAYQSGEMQAGLAFDPTGVQESTVSTQALTDTSETIVYGDCGGQMVQTVTTYADGTFNGTVDYQGYCSQGATLDGGVDLSGAFDVQNNTMNVTMDVGTLTTRTDSQSFTTSGSLTMDMSLDPTGSGGGTFTADMVLTDNSTEKSYWLDDYTVTITPGTEFDTATVSGRFYHHDYGYVDISTPTELQVSSADGMPAGGELRFEGGNGTWMSMTFFPGGEYEIATWEGTEPIVGFLY